MPDTEIGAISIGISADVSQLRTALNQAKKEFSDFKLPEREIPIRVRISTPTQDAINKAQANIERTLTKAQKLGVELTPTLTVKNVKIAEFRNEIQRLMEGQKAIEVDIVPNFDATAVANDIKGSIGTIEVPLRWYWENGEPPAGASFGGGGGGGTPTGGKGGGKGGGGKGTPAPAPAPAPAAAGKTDAGVCSVCGFKLANPALMDDHVAYAHKGGREKAIADAKANGGFQDLGPAPAGAKPTGAKAAKSAPAAPQAAAPVAATPPPAPAAAPAAFAGFQDLGAAPAGATQTAQTPADLRRNRFGQIFAQLNRGRVEGVTELLKAGGKFKLGEEFGGLQVKKRSDLEKFLKESTDSDAALKGLEDALRAYQGAVEKGEDRVGRQAFTGGARALAGETPDTIQVGTKTYKRGNKNFEQSFREMLRREAEQQQKERAKEFANRADVKQIRQELQEKGLQALDQPDNELGQKIAAAARLVTTDPAKAREFTVEALAILKQVAPREFRRLFVGDPGVGRSGGAGPRTKAPRKVAGGTDKVAPVMEVQGAAVHALFGELYRVSLPIRDAVAKAERQEDAAIRKSRGKKLVGGVLVDQDEVPKEIPGTSIERTLTGAAAKEAREKAEKLAREFVETKAAEAKAKPVAIDPYRIDIIPPLTGKSKLARSQQLAVSQASPLTRFTPEELALQEAREAREAEAAKATAGVRASGAPKYTPEELARIEDAKRRVAAKAALQKRAGGGPVRPGGLLARLMEKGYPVPEGAYLVGEGGGPQGEELFVPDQSGHIIDNKAQNIPEWMRRAREGKGLGKDMTGRMREFGGRVQAVPGAVRGGFRKAFAGEIEAIKNAQLAPGGGVQRVFVVNWPGGFGQGAAQGAPAQPQAAAPFTAQQLTQLLGAQVQQAQAGKASSGGGGKGKGRVAEPKLSPLEEAQIEAARQDLITAERLRLKTLSAKISAAIREAPTRGLQTAAGEVSAINIGGLRGVIERRRLADEAATRATVALGSYTKAVEKADRITIKLANSQDAKKQKEYTKALEDQNKAVDFLHERYTKLRDEAEGLGNEVIGTADKFRVFAANTAGIIAGTFIFSGALGAAQAGLTAIGEVVSPVLERLTGFQNVSGQITSKLAEQSRQTGGAVKSTVALSQANVGLSKSTSDVISSLIERRVTGEAANKNLAEQIDQLHTYIGLRGQQGAVDKSVVATTGGLFGTPLFGTPSTTELIGNELKQFPNAAERAAGALEPTFSGASNPEVAAKVFKDRLDAGTLSMEAFNAQVKRGGESVLKLAGVSDEQAEASAKLAEQAGLGDIARIFRARDIGIQGAQTPGDILHFFEAGQLGSARPTPELLIKNLQQRQIPNQLAALAAEEALITRPTLEANRAIEQIANPITPFGAGIVQVGQGTNGATPIGPGPNLAGFGQNAPGVDPQAQSSFNQYKSVATAAIDAVVQKANEGRRALAQLGVPQSLITELETLGNQASGIQLGRANAHAAFEAAQYNRQLFTLNRQLADAKALLGEQAGSQGRLGALQRQNIQLSKEQNALQLEASTLALELQQRQINFQRAIAGFVAPGTTPEERAARIEAAKREADFAQKQLDIQRKLLGVGQRQFKVGIAIFDESARRQVQELQMALAELQQSHQLTLDDRAANQALDAIHAREAQIAQEINVKIEKAVKKASLAINTALDVANASGEAFADILGQTADAWSTFISQGVAAVNAIRAAGTPQPTDALHDAGGHAAGAVFTTNGATSMTVGEAGTETVAVLRNPRPAMLAVGGGGGGGVTLNVFITGNSVRNDNDLNTLTERIYKEVERKFMEKTSLFVPFRR